MDSIKIFLENNQDKVQHTSVFRIHNGIAILADQEEALKDPCLAYDFALQKIPGTDFEKCQEAACKAPWVAHCFAISIPGANIEYCRKACLTNRYLKRKIDIKFPRKQFKKKDNKTK